MEKIESFKVNHLHLKEGLYLSRRDEKDGVAVTTFDLRFTCPNQTPPMDNAAIHTVEHLGATYLRNSDRASDVVYFGPMGCRTGFYLVMFGSLQPCDVEELVCDMCRFVLRFDGQIPGATAAECGNYSEQNLTLAKYYVQNYLDQLQQHRRFVYPQ